MGFARATPASRYPAPVPALTTLRLPIPWPLFGFPEVIQLGPTALATGDIGWRWTGTAPAFGIAKCPAAAGTAVDGWSLDHVVLLVPAIDDAVAILAETGLAPRLRMDVRGRPTAFFRVGPVLEVIESPVRSAAVFGVALATTESLEALVLRWRSSGLDVGDPKPAIQRGRRIFTVRSLEAGLAVMSPDRSPSEAETQG